MTYTPGATDGAPDAGPTDLYPLEAPPDDRRNGHHTPDPLTDTTAERATLGAVLSNPDSLDPVTSITTAADFTTTAHETIYDAALALYSRQRPVDPITVANHLGTATLRRVGGLPYLFQLVEDAAHVLDPAFYALIVADKAARRRLRTHHQQSLQDLELDADADPAATATLYQRSADRLAAIPRGVAGVDDTTTHPWSPVNLHELRATDLARPTATLLTTTHGRGLIYPGRTHSLSGESTTGKSWLAIAGICQEIALGHPVTYLDFEDRADTLITRLHDMGADPDTVDRLVRYIGPDRALDAAGWAHVDTAVRGCRYTVIDGVTEAMTMHGLSLLDNEDIATWYGMLSRRIAATGSGVLEIDHVVKNADDRGRYAIGGAHKLNGITGCAYSMVAGKSFSVGTVGHSRVVVAKDRHGNVGPVGETVAEFHVTPDLTRHAEAMVWELSPSQTTFTPTGRARLTGYMDKVSRFLELSPGSTQSGITAGVPGKDKSIVSAVASLLEEGFVRTEPGPRNATFHYVILPFREGSDTHV